MKICKDCGVMIPGKVRVMYCDDCRQKRAKAAQRKYHNRELGVIDYCKSCGKEYIVKGAIQYLCPQCQSDRKARESKEGSAKYREKVKNSCDKLSHIGIMLCRNCGKVFPYKEGERKICPDCLSKIWTQTPRQGVKIGDVCKCQMCGEEFTATHSQQKFCKSCSLKSDKINSQKSANKIVEANKKLVEIFKDVKEELPANVNDLTGQRFGRLTVIGYIGDTKWRCICECGNVTDVRSYHLKTGETRSCGCLVKDTSRQTILNNVENLSGQKFGRLTAVEYVGGSKWKCICDCGNMTEVRTSKLKSGHTRSCGCLTTENGSTLAQRTLTLDFDEIIGRKYGYLEVIDYDEKDRVCTCRCDCGNIVNVSFSDLMHKVKKSCGCKRKPANLYPRTCRECGKEFEGGPRAYYCPECKVERQRKYDREAKRKQNVGLTAKIGEIMTCEMCGEDTIRNSGNQKFCEKCGKINYENIQRARGLKYYNENKETINERRRGSAFIKPDKDTNK